MTHTESTFGLTIIDGKVSADNGETFLDLGDMTPAEIDDLKSDCMEWATNGEENEEQLSRMRADLEEIIDQYTRKYYAVDTDGKAYFLKNTSLQEAYDKGLKLCVITDGACMINSKFSSWEAPAYIHAIQPDARVGRTVEDAIETIKGMNPTTI